MGAAAHWRDAASVHLLEITKTASKKVPLTACMAARGALLRRDYPRMTAPYLSAATFRSLSTALVISASVRV